MPAMQGRSTDDRPKGAAGRRARLDQRRASPSRAALLLPSPLVQYAHRPPSHHAPQSSRRCRSRTSRLPLPPVTSTEAHLRPPLNRICSQSKEDDDLPLAGPGPSTAAAAAAARAGSWRNKHSIEVVELSDSKDDSPLRPRAGRGGSARDASAQSSKSVLRSPASLSSPLPHLALAKKSHFLF